MRIQGGNDSILTLLAARQSPAGADAKTAEQTAGTTAAVAATVVAAPEEESLDFTQMTPREMKDFAQQLWDAGEIDLTQLFMLQTAGTPLGKVGPNGEFIPLSNDESAFFRNQPVDYFQIAKGAMEFIEQLGKSNDPTSGYANWKGIVEALKKATSGVDVVG